MSCSLDCVEAAFRNSFVSFPRSRKFNKLRKSLLNPKMSASDVAEILCLFLRKLEDGRNMFLDNSFVFVHPSSKARGDNSLSHCLFLFRTENNIKRFCCYEYNTRYVIDNRTGHKFTTKDWISSIPARYVEKPFKFSFFVTSKGYSINVIPKKVMNIMGNSHKIKHDYPYEKSWEKKHD